MDRTGSREADVEFWHRHAVAGVLLSLCTVLTALVYVVMSPDRPNRQLVLGVLSVAGLLSLAIGALPLRRIIRHRLRPWFFACWSTSVIVMLAAGIHFDGGIDSPFIAMLYLPLVYAAMTYPAWATCAITAQVIVVYVAFALADGTISGREIAMLSALLLTGAMSALAAKTHWRAFDDQARLAARLAELADHDGLTGCLNHRAFHERLAEALDTAARGGSAVSVILLDLDGFKQVNDTSGHPAGDALLRTVAASLRDTTRPGDPVGRLGGDEFAVILPATDLTQASVLAERLRAAIAQAGAAPDDSRVTASVGVASVRAGRCTAARLVSLADEQAYRAKRHGGDRVHGLDMGPRVVQAEIADGTA